MKQKKFAVALVHQTPRVQALYLTIVKAVSADEALGNVIHTFNIEHGSTIPDTVLQMHSVVEVN